MRPFGQRHKSLHCNFMYTRNTAWAHAKNIVNVSDEAVKSMKFTLNEAETRRWLSLKLKKNLERKKSIDLVGRLSTTINRPHSASASAVLCCKVKGDEVSALFPRLAKSFARMNLQPTTSLASLSRT